MEAGRPVVFLDLTLRERILNGSGRTPPRECDAKGCPHVEHTARWHLDELLWRQRTIVEGRTVLGSEVLRSNDTVPGDELHVDGRHGGAHQSKVSHRRASDENRVVGGARHEPPPRTILDRNDERVAHGHLF